MQNHIRNEKRCFNTTKARLIANPLHVPDTNIFMYLGHAGDMCDEEGNLIIKTVPPNCIYITGTICGIVNRLGTLESFADTTNADIWRDPLTHIGLLKQMFGPSIHIHLPGCSYVDSVFYGVREPVEHSSQINRDKILELSYSGMMPLSTALAMTPKEKELFEYQKLPINIESGLYNESLQTNELKKYFTKSVYPVVEHKSETIPGIIVRLLKKNRYRRRVSGLMDEFPGIHFNLLCRSVHDPTCRQSVLLRRTVSASVQGTLYNGIYKIMQVQNNSTETDLLEYVSHLQDILIEDGDLKEILHLLYLTDNDNYINTFNLLLKIFIEIIKTKKDTLIADGNLEEIRSLLDKTSSNELIPANELLIEIFLAILKRKLEQIMKNKNMTEFDKLYNLTPQYLRATLEKYVQNSPTEGGRRKSHRSTQRKTLKKRKA